MSSKDDAKKAVQAISERIGIISENDMLRIEGLDPDLRRNLDARLHFLESTSTHPITSVAKKIHENDVHFLFDLLRNADANSFGDAESSGMSPSITFKVHPDCIIIECNNDGLKSSDVEALCAVGGSTKTMWNHLAGANSFGLKAAFKVARKVHIQSGYFSFSFRHRKGESGFGMICPIWEEPDDLLDQTLTRITLHLDRKEWKNSNGQEYLNSMVSRELEYLHGVCLIFLQTIKCVKTEFYDRDGDISSSKTYRVPEAGPNQICIETASTIEGKLCTEMRHYHVSRHIVTGLAQTQNQHRAELEDADQIPPVEEEVVLVFPLTSEAEPMQTKQDIYNFLPIQKHSYKFIIHGNFDLDEKQDIAILSKRNLDLEEGIVSAFVKAVHYFSNHTGLRYLWPRFLPDLQPFSGTFWSSVSIKIKEKVLEMPVWIPEHGTACQKFNDLRLRLRDRHDNPLFNDDETPFVSLKYPKDVRDIFRQYGMKTQTAASFANMLLTDLDDPNSRMKSASTTDSWQNTVADLFICNYDKFVRYTERKIPLLPLRDGQWVSEEEFPVYMPTTLGVQIPLGVRLHIIDPKALANPTRNKLFERLGVKELSVRQVRDSILAAHNAVPQVTWPQSVAHLHYLYLTHHLANDSLGEIIVYDENMNPRKSSDKELYLINNHPFGAKVLLSSTANGSEVAAKYLHPSYIAEPPQKPTSESPSWEEWLHDSMGIRGYLQLVSHDGLSLSKDALSVASNRPRSFLEMLRYIWMLEKANIKNRDSVQNSIRSLDAQSFCGGGDKRWLLDDTWLPLPQLKSQVSYYMNETSYFPFLDLTEDSKELDTDSWNFLHTDFGVGKTDDIHFFLRILLELGSDNFETFSQGFAKKICELYCIIIQKLAEAGDDDTVIKFTQMIFDRGCILVPDSSEEKVTWAKPHDCLWNSPPGMVSKYSLSDMYESIASSEQLEAVELFFNQTLHLVNASAEDIVNELEELRRLECEDCDATETLYRYLNDIAADDCGKMLRYAFCEKKLIFAFKAGIPGWHSLSECAWLGTSDEKDDVILSAQYPELEHFFLQVLGTRPTTLSALYQKMLQTDQKCLSITQVKDGIMKLNMLLDGNDSPPDPKPLQGASIFPVKYPSGEIVVISTLDCDFAIGDREDLNEKFSPRLKVLDFSTDQVRVLMPFFRWLNLQSRCLSQLVYEETHLERPLFNYKLLEPQTHEFQRKAPALFAVACAYKTPGYERDPKTLYRSLREAKVYRTDQIRSTLVVRQGGQIHKVPNLDVMVHIEDDKTWLAIYLAPDKTAQEFFNFSHTIPDNLFKWLMKDRMGITSLKAWMSMTTLLGSVLSCDIQNIKRILEYNGISEVSASDLDSEFKGTENQVNQQNPGTYSSLQTPPSTPERLTRKLKRLPRARIGGESSCVKTIFPPISPPNSPPRVDRPLPECTEYSALVARVIETSRKAKFPTQCPFNMSALQSGLSTGAPILSQSFDGLDVGPVLKSQSRYEDDQRIGAAGELYVFEQFSQLGIRGWDHSHWQSAIRHHATAHCYPNLQPYDKQAGPAMEYQDLQGDLTSRLIQTGYLDPNKWQQARPRYMIAVKTTTGLSSTSFFMSKMQHDEMTKFYQSWCTTNIYIVIRVFSLGKDGCGMRLYLNPGELENSTRSLWGESQNIWKVSPA